MDYMILDTAGNALASFTDEVTAHAAIHAIVAIEREAAEHVVLLAYGDDGMPVGDALKVCDVPLPVTVHASCGAHFIQQRATVGVTHRSYTEHFGGSMPLSVIIDRDDPVRA